jgi:hypothetical protein
MNEPNPIDPEELKQRWRRAVKSAEADKPAVVERDKRLWVALDEQTVSGELRRAILDSPLNTGEISERSNVPLAELNGFLYGENPLDSEAFSRIAQVLHCHLVSSK